VPDPKLSPRFGVGTAVGTWYASRPDMIALFMIVARYEMGVSVGFKRFARFGKVI
jgi:hypothetical protein